MLERAQQGSEGPEGTQQGLTERIEEERSAVASKKRLNSVPMNQGKRDRNRLAAHKSFSRNGKGETVKRGWKR